MLYILFNVYLLIALWVFLANELLLAGFFVFVFFCYSSEFYLVHKS